MFGAFTSFGKLGSLARAIAAAWTPSALWPTGTEAGMWIDPSNLASQWQDSTGTTPVATPGTVADSSNPVGLALDLRLGAPTTLGPELVVNGDGSSTTGWNLYGGTGAISSVNGRLRFTSAGALNAGFFQTLTGLTVGTAYRYEVTLTTLSNPSTYIYSHSGAGFPGSGGLNTTQTHSFIFVANATSFDLVVRFAGVVEVAGDYFEVDNISVREVPGNHLFQATSTARPLLSAYDGQTLGPGNTYDATGYPIFQKYDGTDDGMATASFAAGTLSNDMDCLIAVRRGAAAGMVFGFHRSQGSNQFIAAAESGAGWPATVDAGTPTTWVDGVQLPGGTSTSAGDLDTALTVGDWHILELRGLDLSTWTDLRLGYYGSGFNFNGAFGGALLFPGGNAAGRDAARAWLANKVGVTL